MQLSTYLKRNKLTNAAFAKTSGLSASQISRLSRGQCSVTKVTIDKLDKATAGKVSKRDFRAPKATGLAW
jgi:transcriptional regulator with XRE-family HTH domain